MTTNDEIWQDIPEYEGYYQVSSLGNIRSCERKIIDSKCQRVFKARMLKQTLSTSKHPYFYVSLSKQGHVRKRMVHILVALAFIPNPQNKPQVNHKNGNTQDNRVANLEWVTNAENTQHAYDMGLRQKRVIMIEYRGEIKNLRRWAIDLGLDYKKTYARIRTLKWSVERAFGEGGD